MRTCSELLNCAIGWTRSIRTVGYSDSNIKRAMLVVAVLALMAPASSRADVIISEVSSTSSSNATYGADWFELTNTGAAAVDITGWKMDDGSHAFGAAVALNDVTSIDPGQSVVFMEGTSADYAAFESAWFGASVPPDSPSAVTAARASG